ncbi:GNAT family N-acetyltransferase [uncultured Tenacibaculum sp.]|uniref:GNAT family N-acetyltransferase n=1 Tax=uncultured Tenacibaculum sp. TaxID=174713 RepID=UPI00262FA1CF|nr:GNAT family N-acetyltransferase [uncultured Tenacibaculum sp.]
MIRKATEKDVDQIWEIFQAVIKTEDTYVFSPKTPKTDLQKHWFASYMHTYVFEEEGQILGTYIVKPNQIDLGSHISNASYMVSPKAQGKGIGKKLCEHSLKLAKDIGFIGMQFNIVVSTNKGAVALWKKFGFEVIGITPKAFKHKTLGFIDAYIMYKEL